MVRPRLVATAALAAASIFSTRAFAQSSSFAVVAGTTGIGPELNLVLTEQALVRVSTRLLPLTFERNFSDLDYTIETPRFVPSVSLDLLVHPEIGLRLGLGAIFVPDGSVATANPMGEVEIGETIYQGETIGELQGEVRHASLAPFITLGIGRPVGEGIGFFLDVGAAVLSEPDFLYSYFGPLRFNFDFTRNLEIERRLVERQVRDLRRVFPIASIGIRVIAN
jgi:hypothetical protein